MLFLLVVASEFSLIFTRLNQRFPLPLGFICIYYQLYPPGAGLHLDLSPVSTTSVPVYIYYFPKELMILMILMKGTPLHYNKGSSRPLGPRAECTMGHIRLPCNENLGLFILSQNLYTVILVGSTLHTWTQYTRPPFGNCHTCLAKQQELSQALPRKRLYGFWIVTQKMGNSSCFFKMSFGINKNLWYCFLPGFSHFLLSLPQSLTFDILFFSSSCHK